ncbi:MAG: hypothetical protein VKJ85_11705 [Prochlorothrix sp.]|nr:hypothetical protein [Prochlorothrix sp.]
MAMRPFNDAHLPRQVAALGLGLAAWVAPLSTSAIGADTSWSGAMMPATSDLVPMDSSLTVEVPQQPVLVAELYNLCGDYESNFLVAETENFWLSICGGDYPYTYVGMDKETGDWIELELTYYADDGSWYEAENGSYIYSIIFDTPQGHFLTVTEGDVTILQEYLLDWD